ncbi:unnamed protein product, partial [Mesorhabditis belari]|uniref:Innexin n=1 Tax=Mesorhabditis belari TaxID=2138241 RepID=A0AAF3EWG8_9BILA
MLFGIPKLDKLELTTHLLDDPVDRLNYKGAATVIFFLAAMVSAKQFTGKPIQCWASAEFPGSWIDYAHDYCLVQSTYFAALPGEKANVTAFEGDELVGEKEPQHSYYQWVPVVLALQAIAFLIPNWIWTALVSFFGIELKGCIQSAEKARSATDRDERSKHIDNVIAVLAEAVGLRDRDRYRQRDRYHKFGADYLSNAITALYLSTKMLYVINLLAQLSVLSTFLGFNNIFWGLTNVYEVFLGSGWGETGLFPRVTYCDFGVRAFHGWRPYTLQCVLILNMFNEKIFVFLWFLLAGLLIITSVSTFYAFYSYLKREHKERAVFRWLKHAPDFNEAYMQRFTQDVLKSDGLLVLRFIEYHAGLSVAREVATKLWIEYINPCDDNSTIISIPPEKNGDEFNRKKIGSDDSDLSLKA